MFYSLIKPALFKLDPEQAHNFTLKMAEISPTLGKITGLFPEEEFSFTLGQSRWKFPVGLAAGLDKNARALDFFDAQGFGAIECGTLTLRPQEGNPRPRIFRYPEEEGLRNAMGFPNEGIQKALPHLKRYSGKAPIGVNAGKNKDSSKEESIQELSLILKKSQSDADYFVVNVSSPNTPGLRELQEKSYLNELFEELNRSRGKRDLFLKIAPDLSKEKIVELTHLCAHHGLTGIIATNTTIIPERGAGGVSGRPLTNISHHVHKLILQEDSPLEVIGVGGISSPKDLFDFWRLGGKASQIYTSYIFQGPQILKDIHSEVKRFLTLQNLTLEGFFSLDKEERVYRVKNF